MKTQVLWILRGMVCLSLAVVLLTAGEQASGGMAVVALLAFAVDLAACAVHRRLSYLFPGAFFFVAAAAVMLLAPHLPPEAAGWMRILTGSVYVLLDLCGAMTGWLLDRAGEKTKAENKMSRPPKKGGLWLHPEQMIPLPNEKDQESK